MAISLLNKLLSPIPPNKTLNVFKTRWKKPDAKRPLRRGLKATSCFVGREPNNVKRSTRLQTPYNNPKLRLLWKGIEVGFLPELYPISALTEKFMGFVKADMNGRDKLSALIKAAVELTSAETPDWEFIAARLLCYRLQRDLQLSEQVEDPQNFARKVRHLASQTFTEHILPRPIATANYKKLLRLSTKNATNCSTIRGSTSLSSVMLSDRLLINLLRVFRKCSSALPYTWR